MTSPTPGPRVLSRLVTTVSRSVRLTEGARANAREAVVRDVVRAHQRRAAAVALEHASAYERVQRLRRP